jgi:hypothetical protein
MSLEQIVEITATTLEFLKRLGVNPFIVPSMGSHGGATAESQQEVLKHLGIIEESVNCEIRSSMEVVKVGQLPNELPVFEDKHASKADGIIVINRIKPHTAFRGPVESGIIKMISIGLGKQKGVEACHQLGFKDMAENVPAMARVIMGEVPILLGIASIENSFDKVAVIEVLPSEEIEDKEADLRIITKQLLPKLYFDHLDVLDIDEICKNISGDGMHPNVSGCYPTPYAQ